MSGSVKNGYAKNGPDFLSALHNMVIIFICNEYDIGIQVPESQVHQLLNLLSHKLGTSQKPFPKYYQRIRYLFKV